MKRLNVLISAYSVCPNRGSEPGTGWHWIISLAEYCNLYVITESEWEKRIESALPEIENREFIHFYYVEQTQKGREMGENQGDWRFYYYYRKWQKSAYRMALEILKSEHIDVVHQLNMIGFREPGYLWKIRSHPYVWGPIGGMENVPLNYLRDAPLKQQVVFWLKNVINSLQCRYHPRVRKGLKRAETLIASVQAVHDKILSYHERESTTINETGSSLIAEDIQKCPHERFNVLWVGRFLYTKQLNMALRVMCELEAYSDIVLHVCGWGTPEQETYYRELSQKLGIDHKVKWHGKVPFEKVVEYRKIADVLLYTSIMDGTPHTILEALESNVPVICFDTCGMSAIVNSEVGTKIPISTPHQSVRDFSTAVLEYYQDRTLLTEKSLNCSKLMPMYSWPCKAKQMLEIYHESIRKFQNRK